MNGRATSCLLGKITFLVFTTAMCWLCIGPSALAGSIVGWGGNYEDQAIPPDGNDFADIAASFFHSLALKSDGSVIGWGKNNEGQATPPGHDQFFINVIPPKVILEGSSSCRMASKTFLKNTLNDIEN